MTMVILDLCSEIDAVHRILDSNQRNCEESNQGIFACMTLRGVANEMAPSQRKRWKPNPSMPEAVQITSPDLNQDEAYLNHFERWISNFGYSSKDEGWGYLSDSFSVIFKALIAGPILLFDLWC
jgi:hypothetical protein